MVRIRLSRAGAKGRPFYHVVVTDQRSARDGRGLVRADGRTDGRARTYRQCCDDGHQAQPEVIDRSSSRLVSDPEARVNA